MCLGTVARVVEVLYDARVVVEHDGRHEEVLTMTLDDAIGPGDWVVIHSGFVLERISEARATDALAIRSTPPETTDLHSTPGASVAPHEKELAP
jgi:hydrogenase expression/formation protein HypC